ncbi:MAG: 50S ribosomal protein L3 N(5)-glutamine methyltransferase [Coxiellaceae bacterium]|nr:50S ribosomal protein L3 N(5)-glutamine methyltransferase [Coxiellaceae bacterium]
MKTIESAINQVCQHFEQSDLYYGHGSDNAWDEAVFLVLAASELPLDSDRSVLQQSLTSEAQQQIEAWVQQRVEQRIPLPYIMQRAWFMGLEFYVDPRVLIPRSLMGCWLDDHCRPWVEPAQVKHILEVGTGSGCIAIAAAYQFPQAHVDAVDISDEALAVAKINVGNHQLDQRVELIKSDCYQQLSPQRYDMIISNPPYVSDEEMVDVPAEYQHEPNLALRADDDGLAIVIALLKGAPDYLTDEGVLFMEVGFSDEALIQRYPDAPFVWLDTDAETSGLFVVTREDLVTFLKQERLMDE